MSSIYYLTYIYKQKQAIDTTNIFFNVWVAYIFTILL